MGRNCGYLALMGSIAGGAELVLIPEIETSLDDVAKVLSDAYVRGKAHCIIIVAEGWRPGTAALVGYLKERQDELGFEVRTTVLGHVQRGGSPSAYDRILATRLGAEAAEALYEGVSGVMVGLVGGKLTRTPLVQVIESVSKVNPELYKLQKMMEK